MPYFLVLSVNKPQSLNICSVYGLSFITGLVTCIAGKILESHFSLLILFGNIAHVFLISFLLLSKNKRTEREVFVNEKPETLKAKFTHT
jgi:hypothetical protein